MATNERVSQLLELFATDIQSDDLLLITDMSQRESKKLEVGQLLLFIENSGSFDAFNAAHADTASYILSTNIAGIINFALNTSNSLFASVSDFATSSSYTQTASFALVGQTMHAQDADTASFLQYSGFNNGTASYSLNSNVAANASTAFNLFYNGIPNGTASWAVTASKALNSTTASFALTTLVSVTSSYALTSSVSITSSFASASNIAQTASFVQTGGFGPTFIAPIVIATTTATVPFTTFNCAPFVPVGTKVVLLDGWAINGNTNTPGFINIRATPSGSTYVLTAYYSAGAADAVASGAQGVFPIFSVGPILSFQYAFTQPADGGTTLRLIGYY